LPNERLKIPNLGENIASDFSERIQR